jgi:predicted enzyme related to lactoylglutathione lyase
MRGNFAWHELMTTDTQAASAFYPKVTGWKPQPYERDASYTLFMGNKAPMGGLMSFPSDAASAPPSWIVYIETPDIGGTIAHAQRLGGRLHREPQDIPEIGRFAMLDDPQGATFSVIQSLNPAPGSTARPGLGDFSWHELATRDHRAAIDFYSQLFGWRKGPAHDMGAMGVYQIFLVNGREAGGMFVAPPGMNVHWLSYVNVSDADAAARAATAAGGRIINGPMEVPGGDRIAQILDPQGAAFAVHSYKKAAPAAAPPKPAASQPASAEKASAAKPAASPKAKAKTPKRRPAARKAAAAKKRAASARKRGARKSPRKSVARKSARKAPARRKSTRRAPAKRRPARRPRRAK